MTKYKDQYDQYAGYDTCPAKIRRSLTSQKCDYLTFGLQVLAGATAFFYAIDLWTIQKAWLWVAALSFGFLFLIQLIRLVSFFTLGQVSEIKYTLRRDTGCLYDAWAGFRNVSLRAHSLNQIFGSILEAEKEFGTGRPQRILFEAGVHVGIDFAKKLEDYLSTKHRGKEWRDKSKFLNRILRYDSSSGMGNFVLSSLTLNPVDIRIHVLKAFTAGRPHACEFLRGYIKGICAIVFNTTLKIDEEQCVGAGTAKDDICKFHLYE